MNDKACNKFKALSKATFLLVRAQLREGYTVVDFKSH
ncbi:hypothetical protein [Sporosarcina psychrophila]